MRGWPSWTCANCGRAIEVGFTLCSGCADEARIRRVNREGAESAEGSGDSAGAEQEGKTNMKTLKIVVVMAVAWMTGCAGSVEHNAAPAEVPERTRVETAAPVVELCQVNADCYDADPCVASSSCSPDNEYAEPNGCRHVYRVKGEACGGDTNGAADYGSCVYSTDEHVVGAPVTCAVDS